MPWPPKEFAPGIELRRMPTTHNGYMNKVRHIASMLVPVVVDEGAFYRHAVGSRRWKRPEEVASDCGACRGIGFMAGVRRDGMPTGKVWVCPRCDGSKRA